MDVSQANLVAAAKIVSGFAVRTPVVESPLLNAALGFRLLLKAECLQTTGSFKLRGAYHSIMCLSAAERAQGIVAFSSGNHAQAIAYVARHFNLKATIVMPRCAPRIKRANTVAYGAEVILYDRQTEDRETAAKKALSGSKAILIKPFDDPNVILGQGTAMVEALADCATQNRMPSRIFIPCSGGGLLAGSALAAAQHGVKITVAEPIGFAGAATALQAGKIAPAYQDFPNESAICDALLSPVVGQHCYPTIAQYVDGTAAVSETQVLSAMQLAFSHAKLIVEPGGAAGMAAAIQQKESLAGQTVLTVLSGGNVDADIFKQALNTTL